MRWWKRNLFRRLLVSYLITVLFGCGFMGIVISYSTTNYISEKTEEEMLRQAKSINLVIQHSKEITPELKNNLEFFDQSFDKRVLVFDHTGKVTATSMQDEVFVGREIEKSIVDSILEGNAEIQSVNVEGLNRPMMSVIVPWGKEDEVYGGIVLNSPIDGITSTFRNIREIVLWAMVIGVIISTSMVSYLSWSISRPLKRIEQASTEIALGNYSKRVHYRSYDEIGELVKSFNRMAEKLDQVEKTRQTQEQTRDDFIANISHELRTPLTSMQGFLEALQDGLVKDESSRQRYYQVMYEESRYLNRMVDDLMDLIKLENKQVALDPYFVHVEDIIKKVIFTLQDQVKEEGNEIQLACPETVPKLLADAARLEQIFINLIQNANKFTEKGLIKIDITFNSKEVMIEVRDTGIGIPAHDVDKIWNRFFKVNRGRTKREGGTGLGLAIVKELVELHQGKIEVKSAVGEGTTFTITLPIAK